MLFFLCFPLLFSPVSALTEEESLSEFSEVEKLWEALPEGIEEEQLRPLLTEEKGDMTPFLLTLIESAFSLGIKSGTKTLSSLLILTVLSALFRSAKDSFSLRTLNGSFDFLFLLTCALITWSTLGDCIKLVTSAMDAIQTFFLASLPVTTILMTLSGSPSSGAVLGAGLNMVLSLFSTVNTLFLSPVLKGLFALNLTEGVANSGLSSLAASFQKAIKTLCVLFLTMVCALLSLNNALAVANDSVAMRSVRFAAGNFIPVIGSLVGESAKTLSAAFSLIKTRCGILCLLVLFYLILRPIFCLVVQKVIFSLVSSAGEILSDTLITRFFKSLSSLLDLLLALMISEGIYLIFYIALFLTNKGSLS